MGSDLNVINTKEGIVYLGKYCVRSGGTVGIVNETTNSPSPSDTIRVFIPDAINSELAVYKDTSMLSTGLFILQEIDSLIVIEDEISGMDCPIDPP
jgi:hypothetical protein